MPGWLSERTMPSESESNMANDQDDAKTSPALIKALAGEDNNARTLERPSSSMSQHQRDELIAEVLGDVLTLSEKVNDLTTQLSAIAQAVTANDFVRWRNTLDLKMSELAEINLSQQAATRLQAFATAYLDHLSQETNKLVRIEVKRAVADTLAFSTLFDKLHSEWLLRLSSIAIVVFSSTLLAHLVWYWFR